MQVSGGLIEESICVCEDEGAGRRGGPIADDRRRRRTVSRRGKRHSAKVINADTYVRLASQYNRLISI